MEPTQQYEESTTPMSVHLHRPSGTRWTPTSEQICILRDLYYNCGIRSPNSEQIQRIAEVLRQYGKIDGKNVFYWFQNHKARDRQKKRLDLDVPPVGRGVVTPSSLSMCANVGQLEASACSSSVTERDFMDYMAERGYGMSQIMARGIRWAGVDAIQAGAATRELETLPLFPIKSVEQNEEQKDHKQVTHHPSSSYFSNFHCSNSQHQEQQQPELHHFCSNHVSNQEPRATSLELTLSSHCSSRDPNHK